MFQVYLNVPFLENDEAKALGAKFDRKVRKWYVPNGKNPVKFERWMSQEVRANWRKHYGGSAIERSILAQAIKRLG